MIDTYAVVRVPLCSRTKQSPNFVPGIFARVALAALPSLCFGDQGPSPGFLALQLTILTLSAMTVCPPLSSLNWTFLIRKVQTSSQNRYVERLPYAAWGADPER